MRHSGHSSWVANHSSIHSSDNTSSIRLELNGKASSSKRTRHINIRYFLITDRVKKKEISIEYCPTEEMIADYFTKPLQGSLFRWFRNAVLGMTDSEYLQYKDDYHMNKAIKSNQQGITWSTYITRVATTTITREQRDLSWCVMLVRSKKLSTRILVERVEELLTIREPFDPWTISNHQKRTKPDGMHTCSST